MTQSSRSTDVATPLAAILFVFGSGLVFTGLDSAAKYLVMQGLAPPFVAWARFTGHVVFVFILLRGWQKPAAFRPRDLKLQVVRGLTLFATTILTFFALRTMQLAEWTSISFFAPMLITALAGPMLGEWAGWRRWLAVLAGFVGVVVVTRPGFEGFTIGHALALCATLCNSFYIILTRRLAPSQTPESLILFSALAPAVLMLPLVPITAPATLHPTQLLVLILVGLFGAVGHWLLIQAYRRASATALAPYPYLQLVWSIGAGYFLFNQLPDVFTFVGAGIIIASGLYIVHRERVLRLRAAAALNAEAAEVAEKL